MNTIKRSGHIIAALVWVLGLAWVSQLGIAGSSGFLSDSLPKSSDASVRPKVKGRSVIITTKRRVVVKGVLAPKKGKAQVFYSLNKPTGKYTKAKGSARKWKIVLKKLPVKRNRLYIRTVSRDGSEISEAELVTIIVQPES